MKWHQYVLGFATIVASFSGLWLRFGQAQGLSTEGGVADAIVVAAVDRLSHQLRYDPAYVVLEYPGGDVPADTGVCTDVVVRTYRALDIDLQKLVHEDMKANFSAYPKNWGLSRPDKNIDHRRVPNLQTFFKRQDTDLPISDDPQDYRPGDLVAWDLNDKGLWHIGVVVAPDQFVHNIGGGPVRDRGIHQWTVVGHYRYLPTVAEPAPDR